MNSIDQIIGKIRNNKTEIERSYGVLNIAVFGSYVKNFPKKDSDVDIFVTFKSGYKTFDNFMNLKFYLEELLHIEVDLAIKESVRKEFKEAIFKDALYV